MLTPKQVETLTRLLADRSQVMQQVYYQHSTASLNYRSNWNLDGSYSTTQNRLAILLDGRIVDRNTDRTFTGVRP